MNWVEKDLGEFGRVREGPPESYPANFGLRALFVPGERRPPLRAPGPPGAPSPTLSVIGPDDRERRLDTEYAPLAMICAINADGSRGTGWMVSRRVVVTAAHVLWNDSSFPHFRARAAAIRPGSEVGKTPFGVLTVTEADWRIAPGYDGSGPARHDIAVIRLPVAPDPHPSWFGIGAFSDPALSERMVTVAGYPEALEKNDDIIPHDERCERMYLHRDRIAALRPHQVFYDVDTFRGQSGAPVVMMPRGQDPFSGPVVIGLHTRGQDAGQDEPQLRLNNSATRITPEVMDFIRDFIAETED